MFALRIHLSVNVLLHQGIAELLELLGHENLPSAQALVREALKHFSVALLLHSEISQIFINVIQFRWYINVYKRTYLHTCAYILDGSTSTS